MIPDELRRFVERHAEDAVRLLSDLVAIDSVTGREGPLAELCVRWLSERGMRARCVPCKGRANAVHEVGRGPETLLISGHLDTVPAEREAWSRDPHEPLVRDGRLYGLGASDLKASIAAAYLAALYWRDRGLPGRLVTAFTVEEETTGEGTVEFLRWAERERFLDVARTAAVVTEPTGLEHVCLGNRGAAFVRLAVEGRGGHGSRPHQARNALEPLVALLAQLPALRARWAERYAHPRFGEPTITPTSAGGGAADRINVIPGRAWAVLDCRLTPALYEDDLARLRRELDAWVAGAAAEGVRVGWSTVHVRGGHELAPDHPLARTALSVLRDDLGVATAEFRYAESGNDAVFLGAAGIPTINKVGPGEPEQAHRADESVAIERVLRGIAFYARLAERWLGR